jgi:hypothetical protein
MNAETKDDSPYGVSDSDISNLLNAVAKNGDLFNPGDVGVRRQLLLDSKTQSQA